jgi:hypothetical protein
LIPRNNDIKVFIRCPVLIRTPRISKVHCALFY